MTKKIPINEYDEGNCCPVCGSTRITIYEQRLLYVNVNLKTGKPFIMKNGKMKSMSNRDKAIDFDCASTVGGGVGTIVVEDADGPVPCLLNNKLY